MSHQLKGKNVLITGASSGIGEKIARKAAASGGRPILAARREDRLRAIAEDIKKQYKMDCPYYQLDVRKPASIETVFLQIFHELGNIDVLVNNAGFGMFNQVVDATLEEMEAMFEVNVFGLVACTKMVLPKMLEQNQGHIINIASQAGKMATPKSSLYSATKHAVLGFTNSLRMELHDTNIFVTAVNPGPIKTEFFDIADKSGKYVKNIDRWMLEPDVVADKIIACMFTSKREINLPTWMNMGSAVYQLMPAFFEKIARKSFNKK
ncbi:SDR family NAD(P)-dependent oxidoreductase [Metabacillus arenae]|uniref:SDR family oxidoreductase n=1 Tax=Metabacillus arenae TaxID=2771434 RepID=A0A926NC04_9BACI|nr:SDR family oxidoreductase [Metabacillus arenae]MBD1378744.1 SDR family oxidoreductase [Metabacillus arenae]